MSLNKFLAAGRSFAGMRPDKSPYAMRQENLLPVFESAPRFRPPTAPLQGDLLERAGIIPASSAPPVPRLEEQRRCPKRARGWLFYISFGLLGRARRVMDGDLVQSEMRLENVRVLRNELEDSDLEVVIKKRRVPKPSRPDRPEKPLRPVRTQPPERTWNELTARLFEIGQQ